LVSSQCELSEFQLDWLETKLAAEPERHTLLLLHHHPLPAGFLMDVSAQQVFHARVFRQHAIQRRGVTQAVLIQRPAR
jgi:hypothetical protein